MGKLRVYEMAKEYNLKPAEFIEKLAKIGIKDKKPMSALEQVEIDKIKAEIKTIGKAKPHVEEPPASPKVILRKKPAVAAEPEKVEKAEEEVPEKKPDEKIVKKKEAAEKEKAAQAEKIKAEESVQKDEHPLAAEPAEAKIEPQIAEAEKTAVEKEAEKEEKIIIVEKEAKKEKEDEKQRDSFIKDKKAKKILTKEFSKKSILMEIESSKITEESTFEIHTIEPEKAPLERKKPFQKKKIYHVKGYRLKSRQRELKTAVVEEKEEIVPAKPAKKLIKIDGVISLGELSHRMGIKSSEVIKKLFTMGSMSTINQMLDFETASIIAHEFEYEIENIEVTPEDFLKKEEDKPEDLKPRPPVVTIMGHVDHGKTSLLDAIRKTNVTAGEAGGITQHIGAYEVSLEKGKVVFLDTPGHEAFTALRARGAKVTDIVVLVVAADDGVMPQTIEAINHAKAAKVPILVAINKIDKPNADPLKVKQALTEYGLVPEEWGGDTLFAEVSAKKYLGIKELLELILLQSEVLELKANPSKKARGIIIESKLDKGRGPVATVLIQEGTLKIGDNFITGAIYGRIRAMANYKGLRIIRSTPSTPVEVLGLATVPEAGDSFIVIDDEKKGKQIALARMQKSREVELAKTSKLSLEELYSQIQAGDVKELNIVLKADVQGSAEALKDSLTKLSTSIVKLNVIHSSVGGVTESDVLLASASNAIVIGFNVRPEIKASTLAEKEKVDLRLYTIIYDVVDDIKKAMEGLLSPTLKEKVIGRAEVRETFSIPKIGTIAGCFVLDGKVQRNAQARLLRDNVVVHQGKIGSLRRFKDDAKEVQFGYECGIGIENFNDIKQGDIIEAFIIEETAARL